MARQVRVPLRWRDLDHLGHVYHGTMLTLLDEARTQWLEDRVGAESSDSYVVARVEIDYHAETRIESGYVEVRFTLERVGTKSFTTRETVRTSDGAVVAEAVVTAVLWDSAARRSRAITAAERARMVELEESAEASHA